MSDPINRYHRIQRGISSGEVTRVAPTHRPVLNTLVIRKTLIKTAASYRTATTTAITITLTIIITIIAATPRQPSAARTPRIARPGPAGTEDRAAPSGDPVRFSLRRSDPTAGGPPGEVQLCPRDDFCTFPCCALGTSARTVPRSATTHVPTRRGAGGGTRPCGKRGKPRLAAAQSLVGERGRSEKAQAV